MKLLIFLNVNNNRIEKTDFSSGIYTPLAEHTALILCLPLAQMHKALLFLID